VYGTSRACGCQEEQQELESQEQHPLVVIIELAIHLQRSLARVKHILDSDFSFTTCDTSIHQRLPLFVCHPDGATSVFVLSQFMPINYSVIVILAAAATTAASASVDDQQPNTLSS
jgi:hypothetical protein